MTVSDFYKSVFHHKVYKISLDSGCTCPTRDGAKGTGGCIFCSANGSGDFVPHVQNIENQIEQAKLIVSKKIKNPQDARYIAYFQNFTNTYGPLEKLKTNWEKAVSCPEVVGLAIATRPDCLSSEVLEVLGQLADKTFLQVELGFQTSNEKTAEYIRRHFFNETYLNAVKALHEVNPKIHVVTHLIFGLPGETEKDMMSSVETVVNAGSDGIKITSLYVLKNTDLEKDFFDGKFRCLEYEEYFELIKKALRLLPANLVIHRLTGDPPKALLTAPAWPCNKKRTMNEVKNILENLTV